MAATLVLKVESGGVFESDLRSVWIFELGPKLTEIATFYIIFLRRKGFLKKKKWFWFSHIGCGQCQEGEKGKGTEFSKKADLQWKE